MPGHEHTLKGMTSLALHDPEEHARARVDRVRHRNAPRHPLLSTSPGKPPKMTALFQSSLSLITALHPLSHYPAQMHRPHWPLSRSSHDSSVSRRSCQARDNRPTFVLVSR